MPIGRRSMKWLAILLLLTLSFASSAAFAAESAEPLTLVVMDPLAAPLSCPCVEGYAQRDYNVLAEYLADQLGREVRVGFGGSLVKGQEQAGGHAADLVIGKDSVIRSDAAKLGFAVTPLARLSGRDGKTTQTGLVVLCTADPAKELNDLEGYRIYFGPADSDEKHAAALRLIRSEGAKVESPGADCISDACSDGASKVVELGADAKVAAVISSYAHPLLEGCGTIDKGDLRVIGETSPVAFVTAFATDRVDKTTAAQVREALLDMIREPKVTQALESMLGFLPIDDEYEGLLDQPEEPIEKTQTVEGEQSSIPSNWPGWAGPTRNGHVAWLPDQLPDEPQFVWRKALNRPGLGGIAVVDHYVLLGDRDIANQFDVWRCFDANSGEPVWERRYPAPGKLDYDNAPRATPLVVDNKAYLLGAFGHLSCVNLADGKLQWRRNLRLEYGVTEELVWGLCSSPLLVDGKLIVNPGANDAAWVALEPETGYEIWRTAGDRHGFASPLVATLGGVKQLVGYDRTSLNGWDLETGQRLWTLTPPRKGDFNVPTPLVIKDQLLVMTENNGTRLYQFAASGAIDPTPVDQYNLLGSDMSTPVGINGHAYCVWEDLFCLEVQSGILTEKWIGSDPALPETGTIIAGKNDEGKARLLVIARGGELLVIDAEPTQEMRILSRSNLFQFTPNQAEDLLTQPALVGDRLYLRNEEELVCVRLR